jgi:hypothetical protein
MATDVKRPLLNFDMHKCNGVLNISLKKRLSILGESVLHYVYILNISL